MVKFFRKELLYVMIIILGSMNFGETMAYWSPAKDLMMLKLHLSVASGTIFNLLPAAMGVITPTFIHIPINRLGRRFTCIITAVCATIGWLIIPLAGEKTWIIAFIGRAILGLTVGSFSTVCPLYITEISPTEVRSSYGILHQFGVVIGACLCYLLGIWLSYTYLCLCLSIAPFLHIMLVNFVPESPSSNVNSEQNQSNETIFNRRYIKPLLISALLMFFQQYSGCNAFLSNLNYIFKEAGSSLDPSFAAFLVGLAGLIATGVSAPIIACLGHKPSWLVSSFLCFAALLITALNFWFKWSNLIPAIMMIMDNFVFGLGLGPIPWVITPELFNDSVRAVATSIMTSFNWFLAATVMGFWELMNTYLSFGISVSIFGGIMFLAVLFGFTLLPDTHGKAMGAIFDQVPPEPLIGTNGANYV